MSAGIVSLAARLQDVAPDTPKVLRELADLCEAGRIESLVIGFVQDGSYNFWWPSSRNASLTLATLLQATAINRMREGVD